MLICIFLFSPILLFWSLPLFFSLAYKNTNAVTFIFFLLTIFINLNIE